MKQRKYKRGLNETEAYFEIMCERKGISLSRRGYPDYIVLRDGKIHGFVEVKPRNTKELRKGQTIFMEFCKKYNIPFMKWSPEQDFPEWF